MSVSVLTDLLLATCCSSASKPSQGVGGEREAGSGGCLGGVNLNFQKGREPEESQDGDGEFPSEAAAEAAPSLKGEENIDVSTWGAGDDCQMPLEALPVEGLPQELVCDDPAAEAPAAASPPRHSPPQRLFSAEIEAFPTDDVPAATWVDEEKTKEECVAVDETAGEGVVGEAAQLDDRREKGASEDASGPFKKAADSCEREEQKGLATWRLLAELASGDFASHVLLPQVSEKVSACRRPSVGRRLQKRFVRWGVSAAPSAATAAGEVLPLE